MLCLPLQRLVVPRSHPCTCGVLFRVLDFIVLIIFIVEIVVKLIAEGNQPLDFFRDAWNVFDFLIVAVGLMPFGGNAVTALRLVRLLRVLKLVRALPKLRILVMGLLKSMSSIAYIGLLLGLLFYLYAVHLRGVVCCLLAGCCVGGPDSRQTLVQIRCTRRLCVWHQ